MAKSRSSLWTFVIYPDSLPEDWQTLFSNLKVPCAVSPLHDKDVNGDESEKKAHRHVMLQYDSLKSYDQVIEDIAPFNGTIPITVRSPRALLRYFTHMDNPEKAQYDRSDILTYCGFEIDPFETWSKSERYLIIKQMLQHVDEHNIYEYSALLQYAMESHMQDWFPMLCDSCTVVVKAYIDSKRYALKEENQRLADANARMSSKNSDLAEKNRVLNKAILDTIDNQ